MQLVWAMVKKVTEAFGASVNLPRFFELRKVLERLSLYTCTVVVHRVLDPPTPCRFITTQAVLAAWLVCRGSQVRPAFEWRQVLERFIVYLLLLVQSTTLKNPGNDVIPRHD
jgi:hypothetical protein